MDLIGHCMRCDRAFFGDGCPGCDCDTYGKEAVYAVKCPKCQGEDESCKLCGNLGFVSEFKAGQHQR